MGEERLCFLMMLKMFHVTLSSSRHCDFYLNFGFTLYFMLLYLLQTAPEVLSGGPYSHAADWWSLGITLLSLVTGKVTTHLP